MSFLSRFLNPWKQRQREIESEQLSRDAERKGVERRIALRKAIASRLVSYGIEPAKVDVEGLTNTVLNREFQIVLPLDMLQPLPVEDMERRRWEIDLKIVDEVVKEYIASNK